MPSQDNVTPSVPSGHSDVGGAARLHRRLMLVVLIGILPLIALVMVAAEATRHATLDWLEAEVQGAARLAAMREAEELGQAARLLGALAAAPAPPGESAARCAALLPLLAGASGGVAALAVHGADGRADCATAIDGSSEVSVAVGSAHVRAALAASGKVVMTADPAGLVLARAVDGGGAVLALVLTPSHLPQLALPLRRGLALRLLVDPEDGMVLAAQSDEGETDTVLRAGMSLQVPSLLAALRAGIGDGALLVRDAGGMRRLVGHALLPRGGDMELLAGRAALLVELPYDVLLAEADSRRHDQWLAALAMAAFGVVAALALAQRSLVRPVRRLLARLPGEQRTLATLRPAGAWLRQQGDLAAVAEAAGEMFLRLDSRLRVLYASPATRQLLGYAPGEVVDADLAAEPGWEPCQGQLEVLRRGEAAAPPCRIVARRRDDGDVRLEVRASRLADGGYMLACRDIGAEHGLQERLVEAQARLAALAMTDFQSGLANRRRFDEALGEEVRRARRAQEPLSLVLVRLEDAAHGAPEVGRILAAALRRPGDLAARLEEDLFAVLLPTTDRIGVQRLAERLHEAITADLGQAWTGACSMLPLSEDDGPDRVLALAHEALREAAAPGQGGVVLAAAMPEQIGS